MAFNVENVRNDFPILGRRFHDKPLTYLDNGATTQKPKKVIDALCHYYSHTNSNVGRSVYALSMEATKAFEKARGTVARFINARKPAEIVFTKSTTEAVNFVASTFGKAQVKQGDEVIISEMEHHANLLPWQALCKEQGASLRVVPVDARGNFDLAKFTSMLGPKTKMVAVAHVSNVLGTVLPVKEIVEACRKLNIPTLIDGAQAIAHEKVDVQELGCDFYCFSGHKMYAPMGIGILYGREERLNTMGPYQKGGGNVMGVTFEEVTMFKPLPWRLETGTPNVGGALGLEAAMEYLTDLGREDVLAHERHLLAYATEKMSRINGLKIIGTADHKSGILSFTIEGFHPYDLGSRADECGVAVSSGAHCALPLMDNMKLIATVRASFGVYNTIADVDALHDAMATAKKGPWTLEKPNARF